ncbi:MAG: hypothetical protein ACI9S8_003314 [Chlamydiales bacterium]|jgi:hypothetical protein
MRFLVEKKFRHNIGRIILATALLTGSSSCLYKMPEEDEFRTVPTTNNPNVIKDAGPSITPSIDY